MFLPLLEEIHVWSDVDSSTYKGSPDFGKITCVKSWFDVWYLVAFRNLGLFWLGRMAEWPEKHRCKIIQNLFVEYHACGPQDNAGRF